MTEILAALLEQEAQLQFEDFSHQTAWELGSAIKKEAEARRQNVAIDITLNGQVLFSYAMPLTTVDNLEWINRKKRVVHRYQHSSWYMGHYYRSKGKSIEESSLVDPKLYAPYGGSFPLTIRNVGVIGSITVSGLPQEQDHQLVVDVLARFLGRTSNSSSLRPETFS